MGEGEWRAHLPTITQRLLTADHRTQWCSSSCSWAMSCPRLPALGAGCKPSGGTDTRDTSPSSSDTAGQSSGPSEGWPRCGSKSPWSTPPPGKLRCLMGILPGVSSHPHPRTRWSSHQLVKVLPLVEAVPGSRRFSGRPVPPLTWLLLHTQQGDVIIQVGHGALCRATPSPLRSHEHVPREVRGTPAAALLVAAVEREWGKGGSWESRLHVRATCEPGITLLLTTHRTCLPGFQEPVPEFSPVSSPPGPSGTTVPLGRQMVTVAIPRDSR